MRWPVTCLTFSAFFAIALVSPAQQSNRQPQKSKPPAKTPTHASGRDLSGVWLSNDPQAPGPRTQGVFATVFPPPMTAWAQARYDATEPQYGPRNVLHGNDPLDRCDPLGLPRMLTFYGPFQFIQLPDKILVLYERERIWRQIWMDGRPLPQDPDPSWYGSSIGRWDGDTLVVDTVGLNEKSWVDQFGDQHSDAAHLVERYRRLNQTTMQLNMTLEDPKAYTKPWVSDIRILHLKPNYEFQEDLCVASEMGSFEEHIAKPASTTDK
jgi:hypothetical protein